MSTNVKRPIYNVAHMVNGNDEINKEWVNSSNAIENDLSFSSDGKPLYFYHGSPCDCFRDCEEWDPVLDHFNTIRQKALADPTFSLVWLDLKLGDVEKDKLMLSGKQLAVEMTKEGSLFPPGADTASINVLLGAQELDQKDFFTGFRQYIMDNRLELLPQFGYDISNQDLEIDDILAAFEELDINENIWIGDGISNCISRGNKRLIKILQRRDSATNNGIAPFKVYGWTADRYDTMRDWLMLGVDAIINNYPSRLKEMVEVDFKETLVLANKNVNPWKRIKSSEAVEPFGFDCGQQGFCWRCRKGKKCCNSQKRCSYRDDCSDAPCNPR